MKEILQTKRLILREYTWEDLKDLRSILTDAETMKYYPRPYDEQGCKRWISWNLDNYKTHGFGLWAINLKSTGAFIGDCGITMQNINGKILPELGFHIHKDHHRQGYASEAGAAVLRYIFAQSSFTEIYCYQTADNTPSRKTAETLGFVLTDEFIDDGAPHTAYRISKTQLIR